MITDLSMSNMGGLEFCRRLRLVSEVPVIVLSVKSEESIKVPALELELMIMSPSQSACMNSWREYALL